MDIKKMAELVRAKVKEAEEAGIFDELAEAAKKKENSDIDGSKGAEKKENQERNRS